MRSMQPRARKVGGQSDATGSPAVCCAAGLATHLFIPPPVQLRACSCCCSRCFLACRGRWAARRPPPPACVTGGDGRFGQPAPRGRPGSRGGATGRLCKGRGRCICSHTGAGRGGAARAPPRVPATPRSGPAAAPTASPSGRCRQCSSCSRSSSSAKAAATLPCCTRRCCCHRPAVPPGRWQLQRPKRGLCAGS